ncbi:hypothetical protein Tco_1083567, partial [Tanacetum coccineum]
MTTLTNNSQMHNDIMEAGSKERPPMLAPGRYAQWQSRFLRYVDTNPNKKELRQCIFDGPYNITPEKRAYFDAEAEAMHMILSGIEDDMYSTDACTNAKEMWIAIKRLQQVTVAGARETIGNQEKMMLCKQEERGVTLSAEQGEWLQDTDEELDKHVLEAHYMYMLKIQEVLTVDSGPTFDAELLEKCWKLLSNNLILHIIFYELRS